MHRCIYPVHILNAMLTMIIVEDVQGEADVKRLMLKKTTCEDLIKIEEICQTDASF